MKAIIRIIVIVTVLTGCQEYYIGKTKDCTFNSSPEIENHPRKIEYSNLINEYVKEGMPGISLLIRDDNGTWAGAAGYADIGSDVKMTPCHISKVASITKMFVAVVAFQLVEEGKLELDGLVAPHLPREVVDEINNVKTVTLRQLLSHQSGIYDLIEDSEFYLDVLNDPSRKRTLSELAEFAYGDDPVFAPGATAGYSNTNTLLVAMMLEKITGKPHNVLIRERILDPLGMSDTYYGNYDVLPENTAQGYFDLYNNNTIVNVSNYFTAYGYGGMYSTMFDLTRFIDALLIDKTLLTDASLQEMMKFHPAEENRKFLGAGIFEDFLSMGEGNHAYGHRGRDLGYTADLFWFPNQNTVMVMFLNYGTDSESDLREKFYEFREELGKLITE